MKRILVSILFLAILCTGCANNTTDDHNDTDSSSEVSKSSSSPESSKENSVKEAITEVSERKAIPQSHKINNFEIIAQLPELPTGCEITAMTMALNYYNLNPDKIEMATKYLPTVNYYTYYENGKLMGPDLNNYFVGDPTSVYGYVCGTGAIITAVNSFLSDTKASYIIKDLTGSDITELYRYVSEDKPIVVWTTIEMADRYETEGWYTENGEYVEWSQNDHCSVLIGYTDKTVTIADPILGEVEYDKNQFEKVFTSRGSKCVALFDADEESLKS